MRLLIFPHKFFFSEAYLTSNRNRIYAGFQKSRINLGQERTEFMRLFDFSA